MRNHVSAALFAGCRTQGLFVALLGPDGAGKTTLAVLLSADELLCVRRLYMGRNPDARDVVIPAPEWLTQRRPGGVAPIPVGLRQIVRSISFAHSLAEQWVRYAIAHLHRLRGGIVVFDRFDLESEVQWLSSRGSRLRRRLMGIGSPKPQLIVVLDAPGDVLYSRKREHSPATLDAMRYSLQRLTRGLPHVVTVNVDKDLNQVLLDVQGLIHSRLQDLRSS
jgi:thymidylate kinase